MLDTFGRVATDLRVSLTDRCNLRCTYCMPAEGMEWLAHEQLLSTDEMVRVTRSFCSGCDRTRLTADGEVRNCLFSRDETDLRGLMRNGAADDLLEAAWRTTMWAKAAGHGINAPGFVQPDRPMSAIGG
jgi:cyclic pyranopterin phosphate synthase